MHPKALLPTLAALSAWLWLPAAALAADAAAGKVIFAESCESCHGASGKGDGRVGSALQPPPRDFTQGDFKFDTDGDGKSGTDADLKAVIGQGAGAFGGSPMMAAWSTLSDADVANVVAYIRSLEE